MLRRTPLPALLAGGFALLLLYATLVSAPTPPDADADRRAAAGRECERRVAERVPGARFPFSPTPADADAGGGGYWLRGTVDAGPAGAPVRRNYECLVRPGAPGSTLVDSVRVWQSH